MNRLVINLDTRPGGHDSVPPRPFRPWLWLWPWGLLCRDQLDARVIVVTWYTCDLGRQMWLAGSAPLEDGSA